jgi:hypothetical protein
MLKTKAGSNAKKVRTHVKRSRPGKARPVQLTAEQQARLQAIQVWQREKEEYWNSLSESEKRAEDESWDRVMKRMNEDRKGYRQLFVDP